MNYSQRQLFCLCHKQSICEWKRTAVCARSTSKSLDLKLQLLEMNNAANDDDSAIFSLPPSKAHAALTVLIRKNMRVLSPYLVMRVPSVTIKEDQCKVKLKMVYNQRSVLPVPIAKSDLQWVESHSKSSSQCIWLDAQYQTQVIPSSSSSTTDHEIWLTTAIKYSVIMWEKKLL